MKPKGTHHRKSNILFCVTILLLLLIPVQQAAAQYFGKNKVNYETFDFKIYRTPHFQIYHYLENEEKIEDFAQLAERWYERHQTILLDTFKRPSPLILYNDHADFQQTTVISSLIGVGTGGVTEGLRNRVVMPVKKSNAETNHVLGHEMVHVFQYHMFKNIDTINFEAIGSIPLWMIEGLAEYMSIGTRDPHTAMWMRDAIMNDDIPTLEDMTRKPDLYFPYRYGHAFWSFIAANWGDRMIKPLLLGSGMAGYRRAVDSLLGFSPDTLSMLWEEQLINTHQSHIRQRSGEPVGEKLFGSPRAINISPSISPDGRYVIFLADRDVITIDFYLADVKEERIIRRLTRDVRDTHIDNYSYTESMGTWSPDSKKYALTLFSEGRKKLMIYGVGERMPLQTIEIGELEYFDNPAWSPDGKSILLAGLQQGQSDLYLYHLESGELEQLTDDFYSDQHPAWSPDGNRIVFISDRSGATDPEIVSFGKYRLCEYDLENGTVNVIPILNGVDIYSPQYAPDGNSIYFISAATGIRNLYRYDTGSGDLYRLSDFKTGVSSISELTPALSVARDTSMLAYVHYEKKGYSIYKASPEDFALVEADPDQVDLTAANLVPETRQNMPTVVDVNLDRYPLKEEARFELEPYKGKFGLEAISSVGVGVGFAQTTTAAQGGVSFLFSDMLKRNQLYLAARVNGRIIDAGGQAMYLNQKYRLNWGVSFSHIPSRFVRSFLTRDTIEDIPVTDLVQMEQRIFRDQLSAFGIYPLSKKIRFEAGISGSLYSFRIDSVNYYYSGNAYLGENRVQLDAPDPIRLYEAYVAYVGDNAYFGLTSPLRGYRYRLQVGRTEGETRFWSFIADYRRYFFFKPVGIAFRAMHYGRYGEGDADYNDIYLGYPYYVRGYTYSNLARQRCPDNSCLDVNQITGSKMLVAGAELRIPFTGPQRLALIKLRYVYSDLVLFADGGLAWYDFNNIGFSFDPAGEEHIPVFSVGASIRINLFGALILEPYYAFPLQRENIGYGQLGLFISGGGW
ncbi:MAG: BamA/TamA family outer membrane protein [Bacteroidales bacterium]